MRPVDRKDIDALYAALLTLRTPSEASRFFRDLLTETEIKEFAERWKAARMLARGIPYTVIIKKTGLSSTTIARVAKWVKQGTGGYHLALKRAGIL